MIRGKMKKSELRKIIKECILQEYTSYAKPRTLKDAVKNITTLQRELNFLRNDILNVGEQTDHFMEDSNSARYVKEKFDNCLKPLNELDQLLDAAAKLVKNSDVEI